MRTTPEKTPQTGSMLEEISKVAATLFFEKGYTQTTTREIAEGCGISVGTLYYYIQSKSDFLTVFCNIHTDDIDEWERAVRRRMHESSPEETLKVAVWKLVYLIDKRREMVLFWYHTSKSMNAAHSKAIARVQRRIAGQFRAIIEAGCEQGGFRTSDPLVNAINIHMLCNTWALQHWQLRNTYTVRQYAARCQEMASSIVQGCVSRDTV